MNRLSIPGFDRSGIAAISDMGSDDYKKLFLFLRNEQKNFIKNQNKFLSSEYKWPKDPLNCWSRIWEYPYTFYNIKKKHETCSVKIVDFGSGVTFFPFSLARLGHHVHCVDIDPVCENNLTKAAQVIDHHPGSISCSLTENNAINIDACSIDVVYSISVLEHIPSFEICLKEITRILKPDGLFILTIDLDMGGTNDIKVDRYCDLMTYLNSFFIFDQKETATHPLDMIVQYKNYSIFSKIKFHLQRQIKKAQKKEHQTKYPNLAVWGGVLKKK